MGFQEYIIYLLTALVILYFWGANFRTSRMIEKWAKENGLKIHSKLYIPWHWYSQVCFGFHPANFRVSVKNSSDEIDIYWIVGGGKTWLRKEIKVKNRNGDIEQRITM